MNKNTRPVLRQYQVEMADAIMQEFKKSQPFLAVAATGAGKSLVIAEVADRLGTEPLLVLQPNKEILEQNYAKMMMYGLDAYMYSASVGTKEIGQITLATIGSIKKNPQDFKHFKYCMFDEAHTFSLTGKMYKDFFKATGIKAICGLTATPFRLSQTWFGDLYTGCVKMLNRMAKDSFFKSIVYKVEMKDLIKQGYLIQPIYHTYDTDLSSLIVNTTGSDYNIDSLIKWGNQRIGKMMDMAEHLNNTHKRILVFCTSVEQAEKGVAALKELGMTAAVVSAKTPKKEREGIIDAFQKGEVKWMLNCQTMTTGFDCPALDAVVLLRPTFSVSLLMQMVGRAVRLDPDDSNKEAHIYDYTGNIQKFGPVEEITIEKEDGWKDMLVGAYGRIDREALFTFDRRTQEYKEGDLKSVKPDKITREYLFSII